MDEETIIRQLVGAYNPEDALSLPFSEQRAIIREISGYTVSDQQVAQLFLQHPELDVLVDDPVVARAMRADLQEQGYSLPRLEDLRAYMEQRSDAVLAREPSNWPQLQDKLTVEEFAQALLRAGTTTARVECERLQERELTNEELRILELAALDAGDFNNLNYIVELDAGLMVEYEEPEDRRRLLSLSDRQVRNAIAYEERGGDDFTTFFPPAYYLAEAVPEFLYYMSELDERGRMIAMQNLPGWVGISGNFDVNHPVVQAYIEHFPDDETARELALGGEVALRQMSKPNPLSDYSRSRGELYVSEQRYKLALNHFQMYQGFGAMNAGHELEQARQEVNYHRRLAGLPEYPEQ